MNQTYCPYCMTPVKPGEPCPNCGLTGGSYHAQPHHLPPGTVLADRYMLGRVLGEGGFGITYIGCDTRLELRVAVKEYFPGNHVTRNCEVSPTVTCFNGVAGQGFEKGRERFIREARTMAKMDKTPQIVAVRDFFQENDTAYIVMEYVDGTTFKELVSQRGGGMSARELLPMVEPLFGALETMHQQGLIHRDISPDNLMLENGMVRLLDFGCARESEKGNETMTIVLKQGYSPVEQYQHKGQGPWTDVYSLAATLYYCLTGKTPPQALDRICDDELVPPRKLGADLTREQELALLYGMGLQPTRRFRSVREFYAALYQGAPVPLVPASVESESPSDTGEEEIGPERSAEAPPESAVETSPESAAETPRDWEPAGEQAEEQAQPGQVPARETEAGPSTEAAEASQPGETGKPARETEEKPGRKKGLLIGGAIAAAALILALVLIVPRLAGSKDPAAEGSDGPAASVEPLPENQFDNAARAADRAEFQALLDDGSVSAVIIPEGHRVHFTGGEAVEIAKPVRLEPNAALYVSGGLTVSSTVQVMEGAWIDQEADFTLTGSGALYIGQDGHVHVSTAGEGDNDIAGAVQVAEGGDFWINGKTVSLSGIVQVSESGFAGFDGFTTVSGEGRISVDGYANCGNVLRTVDGGSITVGDTGWMDFNVLWLETAADLSASGDHMGLDQLRYIVADGDGAFENAAHVNSFRELEQAVNDRLVSAVVIDSSFELEYSLAVNKPLLVSEGAVLTGHLDASGVLSPNDLVVVRGEVSGSVQIDRNTLWLNYGRSCLWTMHGEEGRLLNQGSMVIGEGHLSNGAMINLAELRFEPGEAGGNTYFLGGMMENFGEITLASDAVVGMMGGTFFENRGETVIGENARLENGSHISTGNLIRVRGVLDNSGGVLEIGDPSCLSMEGGRVEDGIIETGGDGVRLENSGNITSMVLTLRDEPGATVEVSSADELLAETDKTIGAIRVTGDITVDASISLKRDLIIDSGARLRVADLTVSGGKMLCVRGELETEELTFRGSGQLRLEGGGRIDAGALALEDSTGVIWGDLTAGAVRLNSARLINWGNMLRCGELTLEGYPDFYNCGNLELAENAAITVNGGGGTFANQNWLEMPSGSITVGDGGRMLLCGGVRLCDGVTVTNRGSFDVRYCQFNLDGGASLTNYYSLRFFHWDWQFVGFGGEVTNRGYLYLNGGERVDNVLNNYGEMEISCYNGSVIQIGDGGVVNNNGTAFTYNRGAGYQGRWTGRALEYR